MTTLEYALLRYSDCHKSTQGLLFQIATPKLLFQSHIIEDEHKDVKVPKETRIWAGRYPLRIHKADTPLTLKHRIAYNKPELGLGEWFKYHIEICEITQFSGVYLHAGNDQDDTEACVLPNDTMGNNTIDTKDEGSRSIKATHRLYTSGLYDHLDKGGLAFITIKDEDFLTKALNLVN